MSEPDRVALLVAHTGRPDIVDAAHAVIAQLVASGFVVRVLAEEIADLSGTGAVPAAEDDSAGLGAEVVIALGGDGTMLRAAALARPHRVPLLGANLGRVGFLAEVEADDLPRAVARLVDRDYTVEERLTLDVSVWHEGRLVHRDWALNEATVEKASRERMLEVLAGVDDQPLSRWGCDGVIFATPTGSTAYAFSAGGPVVWPEVAALSMVPISAHSLFARPMVTAPDVTLAVELVGRPVAALLFCDGRRTAELPARARIEARRSDQPLVMARVTDRSFTDRLVAKFALPIHGWRGDRE